MGACVGLGVAGDSYCEVESGFEVDYEGAEGVVVRDEGALCAREEG